MQTSFTAIAATRFGTGVASGQALATNPASLLAQLGTAPPPLAGASFDDRKQLLLDQNKARAAARKGDKSAEEASKRITRRYRRIAHQDALRLVSRGIDNPLGFHERLAWFWTDHFTVAADGRRRWLMAFDMVEQVIRPNIAGRFADMLKDVVRHPAMLIYLNQSRSVGPNSRVGQRRKRGLNENLAREILELHTLGVGGGYTQGDVREFAELLTGMTLNKGDFQFDPGLAEPGPETVLGKGYGSNNGAALVEVEAALEDLAMHPQTARHLARKLITHFIGPNPPEDYVADISNAYLASGGQLTPAYRALLEDDRAWELPLANAKTPLHFAISTMRAMGIQSAELARLKPNVFNSGLMRPLAAMGQPMLQPVGPDGWPEDPSNWITPAGLAARVEWANRLVQQRGKDLDPKDFLQATLGALATPALQQAVGRAETRHEGVTIALASPAFNRR